MGACACGIGGFGGLSGGCRSVRLALSLPSAPTASGGARAVVARYRVHTIVRAMKEAGIGRPSTYAKTVDRLEERDYITTEEGALIPTKGGRDIWLEAAPLFCLRDEREVFQTEYTAAMETQLDDVAEGRRDASEVWETMRDEFKSAHAAAQEAGNAWPLVPHSRLKLQEYVAAAPKLVEEIGLAVEIPCLAAVLCPYYSVLSA